jgi:hypothetical protein
MVNNLPISFLIDAGELPGLRVVDQLEQRRKGVAQIEAAAAAVADIENPLEFLLERGRVMELRFLPPKCMACGRPEAALVSSLDFSVRQGYLPTEIAAGSASGAR